MKVDLPGRIANTNLPFSRPLLPLFEAIVNAIHGIEDAKMPSGRIDVYIKRDSKQQLIPGETKKSHRPIAGFVVADNGIGFTEAHYNSFGTSDSRHKKNRGAKGIGRFIWLKAFKQVTVGSIFQDGKSAQARSFQFQLPDGIVEHKLTASNGERLTTVHLDGLFERYEETCPKKAVTVAERIIEHCLFNFLGSKCPKIVLHDDDEDVAIDLDDLFQTSVKGKTKTEKIKVGEHDLTIQHVKIYAGDAMDHQVHLCANERDVKSVSLYTRIPALRKKLKDSAGELFIYNAYIAGSYLDKSVNAERTDFNFIHQDDVIRPLGELTEEQLVSAVVERSKLYLGEHLLGLREEMRARVENLVKKEMPELRSLLQSFEEHLDEIPHHLEDGALKLKLNELQFKLEESVKVQALEIIAKKPTSPQQLPEYKVEYDKYIKRLNDTSQSRLAQYVVHRKALLSLLEERLKITPSGKYQKEDTIHDLIFTRRQTSDTLPYGDHNLWVIDERLAYHSYLASDLELKKIPASGSDSKVRPDLIVFNTPTAFTEPTDQINSVVIIEFKRPERANYDRDPFEQVYSYIDEIKADKAKRPDGRVIHVGSTTPFYCYILCDITDPIKKFAKNAVMTPTPDREGYFGFNQNYNAYVELISFDKLVSDSKKRNRALFVQLGLADI